MPSRDWTGLGWTPTLNFALQNERQLAQSSLADAGKGAEYKFNPTALNAQLLASLGYGGQGLTNTGEDYGFGSAPQWSDDARTWLANNGYTVGVAHDPNTSPGGRPEYYGLVDKNGNYVAGQDDPTMTVSDTMMDQIIPFAMMAGPFLSAAGAFGGAAEAGAGLSAADGVSSIAPEAIGGVAGTDYSALLSELSNTTFPGVVDVGAGSTGAVGSGLMPQGSNVWQAVQNGALRGAGTGAIKGLATGQNPLQSAVKGALSGAIGGGISSVGSGALGNAMSLDSGSGSMDIIPDAFGNASGAATDGLLQNVGSFGDAAGSVGGGMDWSGVSDWFSNWSPDSLNLTQDITGDVLTQDLPTFSGGGLWNPEYLNLLQNLGGGDYSNEGRNYSGPGGINPVYNSPAYTDNLEEPTWLDTLKGWLAPVANGSGGTKANPIGLGLAALLGGGLGAASGGGTVTKTQEPWSVAQPYLTSVLGDAGNMRANLAAQPYTPQQTAAYGNAFAGLDQARAALPDLLSWGQSAMQRQSTVPSYAQLFGGQQTAGPQPAQAVFDGSTRGLPAGVPEYGPFTNGEVSTTFMPAPKTMADNTPDFYPPGLLGQQPTAQAGGVGGLLGIPARQALASKPRGLIG